jgi:hypothetical protein
VFIGWLEVIYDSFAPLSFDLAESFAIRTENKYRQISPPFAIVFLDMNQLAS